MYSEEMIADPISGQSSIRLTVDERTLINTGADSKSTSVASVVHKDRSRYVGPVLEKKPSFSHADQFGKDIKKSISHYAKMWKVYRDAGMNVVGWIRQTDKDTILMPDLTADGSALYGKAAQRMLNESELYGLDKRKPSAMDPYFLELTNDENFPKVIEKAKIAMETATKNGIYLPDDDDAFELFIHADDPMGSWELITLDVALSYVGASSDPKIQTHNKQRTALFLADLQQIRAGLLQTDNKPIDVNIRKDVYSKAIQLL